MRAFLSNPCKTGFAGPREVLAWFRDLEAPIALLEKLWHEEDAQDMVEYAMLLGFIVLCAVIILTNTRTQISTIWSTINSSLSSAISTGS